MAKRRSFDSTLAMVAALAILVRVLFFAVQQSDPILSLRAIDEASYDDLARRFAGGDFFFGRETLWFAPLYPVALGILYAMIGPHPGAAIVLQHALGVMTAVLATLLGRRLGSPFAGVVAGILLAVLPTAIYAESRLLYTGPLVFATAAFLLAFAAALEGVADRRALWRAAAAGLLLGAGGLLRANMLIFVPLGLRMIARAHGARAAAVFALGIVVTLLPVLLRNGIAAGEWTPWTANGGMILATAFAEDARGGRALERTPEDFGPHGAFHREAERALGRSLTLGEAAKHHEARAIEWIRSHPRAALELTGQKLELLWSAREIDDNMSFTLARDRTALLSWMPFPWAIVVIPGAMGTLVALRGRDKTARRFRMLVWYTLAVAATLLVFFVTSRYRLPLIVPAALLAGYGVERTMRAVRSRDVRGAATLVLAGAGAAWASLRDPGVRADPALELVAVGAAFENRGDHANALRATDEALRRNPNIAGAWHNRALALEELGRSEEALESLEQATRIDPALGPAWQTKGVILARAGRIEEAIDPFRRAAELMPHSADALENLARALGETGRCAEALEAGRRALDAGARAIAPEVAEWEECARRASAPGSR